LLNKPSGDSFKSQIEENEKNVRKLLFGDEMDVDEEMKEEGKDNNSEVEDEYDEIDDEEEDEDEH